MIITLCGSARFEKEFHLYNKILTLSGHTVFSLACFPSAEGNKTWYSEEQKISLDAAHQRKIELSHAILVINKGGYIGESTIEEIDYARIMHLGVYFISSPSSGPPPFLHLIPLRLKDAMLDILHHEGAI